MATMDKIGRALLHGAEHYQEQPDLASLARVAGLSSTHFQREFQRLVGISPKAFIQHLSARRAVASLRAGQGVLQSSLEAGLSGPGRLHDLTIKVEGLSPGEVAAEAAGRVLHYGLFPSPFGMLFAAVAPRVLTYAGFEGEAQGLAALRRRWPKA